MSHIASSICTRFIGCVLNSQASSILLFSNSQYLAARLHLAGCSAAAVSGETDPLARQHFIRRFKSGDLRVLCNHSVLTTGFDASKADMILIPRPVFSPVRYMQMAILAIQPVALLVIHHPSFTAEQDVDPEVAISHPALRDVPDAHDQRRLIGSNGPVSYAPPIKSQHRATTRSLTACTGHSRDAEQASNFFYRTSCRMCLSKRRSAASCLSFRFSSSSCFSRRSSPTPNPRTASSNGKTSAPKSPSGAVPPQQVFLSPPDSTRRQSALRCSASSSRHAPCARGLHYRETLIQTGGRNRGEVKKSPLAFERR